MTVKNGRDSAAQNCIRCSGKDAADVGIGKLGAMKLLRYGPKGQEKPGLLDADGRARSLAGVVDDIDAPLLASGFAELRSVDPAGLPLLDPSVRLGPPLASIGKFICIGLNYTRPRRGSGHADPRTSRSSS